MRFPFLILTFAMCAIIAAFVATFISKPGGVVPTQTPPIEEKKAETAFDRVNASGTIRCGYTHYSVALFKDDQGQLQGIYKDMMDEIGKLLDLKVEWAEEVGWGEQIAGLNANRYDMMCSPANMTGPRARGADFVTPFYYSPIYAWVRADDDRFGTDYKENMKRADSDDIKIATIDGEQAEAQAKQFFPKAQLLSAPQSAPFSTMFMNVAQKKADVTIAEPVSMQEFLDKNPDHKLVRINPNDPLILAVNIMMVKNTDAQLKAMISNAITILIANGVVDQIIHKWEPYPNSYILPPRVK